MNDRTAVTTERWRRIEELFNRAVAVPPEQRAAFLDAACGDDQDLRAEVESLLAHDAQADKDFLASPIVPAPSDEEELPAWVQKLLGQRIGRYTVVRLLGHGGMGCVFEAVQEQPARPVALKVLQPGLSAPSALARFRLEPELLGRLRHPNIAQVYEAGIHEEEHGLLPYFAMEYIPDAQPLLDYANGHGLTTRQRLELFAKVCDAIHHGHQKGIIHRDIKPGNILVGADGEPKVIDFGVARASDADIVMTTLCTHVGDVIGTMQYMSPEQCDGNSGQIDTRSDIYSLGVVLYELLTGNPPYDTTGSTIYAATRVIKEQVPVRLSTVVAERRALARELRGDIDTIVLKALEKDREKRYASAAELATDIRRHLNHEPILARPPTRWTRATRWVGRHPYVTTAAACLLLAALVLAAGYAVVWALDRRPSHFVLIRDPEYDYFEHWRAARLVALSGRTLRSWGGPEPWSVKFAEVVDRPRELGGGKVAVVLHKPEPGVNAPYELCIYDTRVSLYKPEWKAELEVGDPLPDPHRRGYKAREFMPSFAALMDVFPEHPGLELFVCHNVYSYSQCVLRIYDLRGEVLYQVWHDGQVNGAYWMADAKLLVLFGLNSEVYWEARGYPGVDVKENPHPYVVYAIRPRYGERHHAFLRTQPGDGPLDPAWYKCLWPPETIAGHKAPLRDGPPLRRPLRADPGRAVHLSFGLWLDEAHSSASALSFEIDEHGEEIPGSRVIPDPYNLALAAAATWPGTGPPDPNLITLRDLPPIVGPSRRSPATQPSGPPATQSAAP